MIKSGIMLLKFSNHFQVRIVERGINIDHVKSAIRSPDSSKSTFEGKIQVNKKVDGKEIEVIYYKSPFRDKKEEYIVITAYYI